MVTTQARPIDEGLVIHLPFKEGTGTVAYDKSKYQNHGVLSGATAQWVTGRMGGTAFRSVTDGHRTSIPAHSSFDFTSGDFSVAMWYKTNSDGDQYPVYKSNGWIVDGWMFQIYLKKLRLGTNQLGAYQQTVGYDDITLNIWQHIGFSRTGSIIILYLDGRISPSYVDTPPQLDPATSTADMWILNYGNAINKDIEDLRIYNRCLSPEEFRELYSMRSRI